MKVLDDGYDDADEIQRKENGNVPNLLKRVCVCVTKSIREKSGDERQKRALLQNW